MADRKRAAFFFGTMIKLSLFLVFCAAANYVLQMKLSAPFSKLLPSVAAAVITWFFLTFIERNTRSFFATGYLLRNVVTGGVWGFAAAIAGPLAAVGFGVRNFILFPNIDITAIFLNAVASGIFPAILLYGYFFHIFIHDVGVIPAIAVTSVIYGILNAVSLSPAHEFIPTAAYFAVIGIAAGMLIIGMGDIRSAAAFFFIHSVMTQLCDAYTTGGRSFETDLGAPIMAVLCAASMFIGIQKEKKEKENFLNY